MAACPHPRYQENQSTTHTFSGMYSVPVSGLTAGGNQASVKNVWYNGAGNRRAHVGNRCWCKCNNTI